MLTELRVENFAIIDRLDIQFQSGLITFTGETGAGKSIIVDAVEAVLGGRVETTLIRSGASRANIEAVFSIPEIIQTEVVTILEREELLDDPCSVILAREIRQNGRSIARINGRSVNTTLLREVGEYLIDVHGQSEHLSLLRVSQHLDLLDRYVLTDSQTGQKFLELLTQYGQSYKQLMKVRRDLAELRALERDTTRRADILAYQIKEIDTARLLPDEEDELRKERNRLANAEGLTHHVTESLALLDEGNPESPSIIELLGTVVHTMGSLVRLDPSQSSLQEQAQSTFDNINDLSTTLRTYLETIEFNPQRLDQVEERLALIIGLKRKYGDSIKAVLEFAANARHQLETITHAGERLEELQQEETRVLKHLSQTGQLLSWQRRTTAEKLSQSIENELKDLHMVGARFMVDFQIQPDPNGVVLDDGQHVAFTAAGLEKVEFLIAPNPGEGFKPLVKIASGGETSRLMLALKNVLAKADHIPTLIFDEIDQGIGGRVGGIVGAKLWSLARQHQVLCITHLPQLAAYGEQHFHVLKQIQGGRTATGVVPLEGENRLRELALMMGNVTEGTLQSARELIQAAHQYNTVGK